MQKSTTEIRVSHLETEVQRPQRSTETVANTGETTTRRRVRLKHHERLANRLCKGRRVQVWLDNVLPGRMIEVVREHVLWEALRADLELGETIVCRVPFDSEDLQFGVGCEAGVPNHLRCPA